MRWFDSFLAPTPASELDEMVSISKDETEVVSPDPQPVEKHRRLLRERKEEGFRFASKVGWTDEAREAALIARQHGYEHKKSYDQKAPAGNTVTGHEFQHPQTGARIIFGDRRGGGEGWVHMSKNPQGEKDYYGSGSGSESLRAHLSLGTPKTPEQEAAYKELRSAQAYHDSMSRMGSDSKLAQAKARLRSAQGAMGKANAAASGTKKSVEKVGWTDEARDAAQAARAHGWKSMLGGGKMAFEHDDHPGSRITVNHDGHWEHTAHGQDGMVTSHGSSLRAGKGGEAMGAHLDKFHATQDDAARAGKPKGPNLGARLGAPKGPRIAPAQADPSRSRLRGPAMRQQIPKSKAADDQADEDTTAPQGLDADIAELERRGWTMGNDENTVVHPGAHGHQIVAGPDQWEHRSPTGDGKKIPYGQLAQYLAGYEDPSADQGGVSPVARPGQQAVPGQQKRKQARIL